jgi:hypothetical protein
MLLVFCVYGVAGQVCVHAGCWLQHSRCVFPQEQWQQAAVCCRALLPCGCVMELLVVCSSILVPPVCGLCPLYNG